MNYDAFIIVMALIAILSAGFFFLALVADIAGPWLLEQWQARRVRPQARYLVRKS